MGKNTVDWFSMREKYCSLTDKSWLISQMRPSEQAVYRLKTNTDSNRTDGLGKFMSLPAIA